MYWRRFTGIVTALFVAAVLFGRITDITTGQPLAHVTVAVGEHHTKTDADGNYRLVGLAPGRQTVTVSSNDVLPHRARVTVTSASGGTEFDLKACSTTLDYGCTSGMPGSPLGPG